MRVQIRGYRLQTNSKPDRVCEHKCKKPIRVGDKYVRVMRLDGRFEIFDVKCFEQEFGQKALPRVAR